VSETEGIREEPASTPLEILPAPNPVDMGWVAVRTRDGLLVAENSRLGSTGSAREVTVKFYGVAVTMPQG